MKIQRLGSLSYIALLLFSAAAASAENNLADFDLATLMTMDVTVTSAAKHAQTSSDAAAAVYVITHEDIRRSGVNTLPELLRAVPGLQVSRVSTRSWAVSARGSSSRFANKLLVMIDGRSIYTAIFSGVMWEEQFVPLHNIERIEVIRGPGGALWGINAVNGVINIITRAAADAPGAYFTVARGDVREEAGATYAGASEVVGAYRLYAHHDRHDALDDRDTDVERINAGWRIDREAFGGALTFEGEMTDSDFSEYDGLPDSAYHRYARGGSALLDWRRDLTPGQLELRAMHHLVERGTPGQWDEAASGFDAQFSAQRSGAHQFSAGAGYRRVIDVQRGLIPALRLAEPRVVHDQWSVYAQDEVHFMADAARLIVGAKLERFEFTGLAVQPTLRGLWKYDEQHTFWAAVSRALRSPSRFELHSQVESSVQQEPFPVLVRMTGDEQLNAERLMAYEFGWRWRPAEILSFDLALYQNDYRDVIGALPLEPLMQPGMPPYLLVPILYANSIDARARGAELAAEWQPLAKLRFQASLTLFNVDTSRIGANLMTASGNVDPEEAYTLRARIDPLKDVELDLAWRYASALNGLAVPAYDALDLRAAWRPVPTLELSLSIQNVLDGEHIESRDEQAGMETVLLGRNYLARFVWRPKM